MISVNSAKLHTADAQYAGIYSCFQEIAAAFSDCPNNGFSNSPAQLTMAGDDLLHKMVGMNTDHAKDQKKLTQKVISEKGMAWIRFMGEANLLEFSLEDWDEWSCTIVDDLIKEARGPNAWEALGVAETDRCIAEECKSHIMDLGEAVFDKLLPDEQHAIMLFIWARCCMHKDLNVTKGRATRMTQSWAEHNLVGLMLLLNKDNCAAVALAAEGADALTAAEERAINVSESGAVKLCALVGMYLNNKDDKKGVQDLHQILFMVWFLVHKKFPDTSNT